MYYLNFPPLPRRWRPFYSISIGLWWSARDTEGETFTPLKPNACSKIVSDLSQEQHSPQFIIKVETQLPRTLLCMELWLKTYLDSVEISLMMLKWHLLNRAKLQKYANNWIAKPKHELKQLRSLSAAQVEMTPTLYLRHTGGEDSGLEFGFKLQLHNHPDAGVCQVFRDI